MWSFLRFAATALAGLKLAEAVTLTVSKSGGNASSPILYGMMFEDINNSGDGGIHGQLLKYNGFQGTTSNLEPYSAVGGTNLTIDSANPLTSAITKTLKVTVPSGSSGQVGFTNAGYNGVPVSEGTYQSYFWVKGNYSGNIVVSLVGRHGSLFGSSTVKVNSNNNSFTYYTTQFNSKQSPSGDNMYQLTFDAATVKGGSLNFGLVQLFPATFHNRPNGLRSDVASFVDEIGGSFLRFPGGNNIEGSSAADRWAWNMTVGPVQDRPGRQGDWGYPNSDALGLVEYMQWTQDMSLAPVLAIWSGHDLNGGNVVGSALDTYVQDALNELEFLTGDTGTTYGKYRASLGYSEPWNVSMVEIGNEDNLSGGCSTYAERFTAFYNAIHAKYPHMTIIASTTDSSCLPNPLPAGAWTDIHYYLAPDAFVAQFNEWDNQPRDEPIFVGEYASTTGNDGSTTYWSNMQGSCSEAVYMIGMERNSDVVKMASFAPMLEHFDLAQWSPDLMGFNSSAGSITGSTSYYVQKLFATNRGQTILPVSSDSAFGPVYWVASSTSSGAYYTKLANYGTSSQSVTIKIPGSSASSAILQMVSGGAAQSNYPLDAPVSIQSSTVSGSAADGFTVTMPAYGVAVLIVK